MSRPIPGRQYEVSPGDTFGSIATAAYGDVNKWNLIWDANQAYIRTSDHPALLNGPSPTTPANLGVPKEVLFIPEDPAEVAASLFEDNPPGIEGDGPDDFSLLINDRWFPVTSATVTRAFNTAADAWTAELAWDPEGEAGETYDKFIKPFQYQQADVYLGGKLVLHGRLYIVERSFSSGGHTAKLSGFSWTADAIDSNVWPPYEQRKVSLEDRARQLLGALSIDVEFDVDEDQKFHKVVANRGDTVFSHLARLAKERSVVISCTLDGKLKFTKETDINSKAPAGSLIEGVYPLMELSANYNGRARFNAYRLMAQKQRKKAGRKQDILIAIATDDGVPKARHQFTETTANTETDIWEAAEWHKNRAIGNSMQLSAKVASWYAPGTGDLWEPGDVVSVVSPTVFAPDGFDFMVKAVTFSFSKDGTTANLSLVPPGTFSGEEVEEPWRQ